MWGLTRGAVMSQTLELDRRKHGVTETAGSGLTVDAWVEALPIEKAVGERVPSVERMTEAAVARILEVQKRVKPDADGRTGALRATHRLRLALPGRANRL